MQQFRVCTQLKMSTCSCLEPACTQADKTPFLPPSSPPFSSPLSPIITSLSQVCTHMHQVWMIKRTEEQKGTPPSYCIHCEQSLETLSELAIQRIMGEPVD